MKDLAEIIKECNLSYDEVKQNHESEFYQVFNREKSWLNNVEDKLFRLTPKIKEDVESVISNLKEAEYLFTNIDTPKLSTFVSQINSIIRIANRINNFKEGISLENGKTLHLHELFNAIKITNKFKDFSFPLNKNLKSFIVHLYSIVKHCQDPDYYPIYYKYWKNIFGEVLNHTEDYDSLCDFYRHIESPKHVSMGAYFGALGIIIAKKITDNNIIKVEGDKNYNYIRSKLLNIHYFDLITGYKRSPNYFLIGSKYGINNDEDVFPQMKAENVIAIGFGTNLDLSEFYLSDESEITEYLKEENQNQSAITALRHFLSIKIGDLVAIKASGSPKGNKGFLSIVAICEVVPNENGDVYNYDPSGLGHTLNVQFLSTEYKEFELGGYGSTVHKMSIEEHIKMIFGNETMKQQVNVQNYKIGYLNWLNQAKLGESGKPSAYIRALEILSKKLNYDIFEIYDFDILDELYKDLVKNQRQESGKYFFEDAPSYGNSGFYSASISEYIKFLKNTLSESTIEEAPVIKKNWVNNKLAQAICVIGISGVGKTYRVNKTLEKEGHETLFVILDNMWQHILFDYSPHERKYCLTKVGEFIKQANNSPEKYFTVVFDECHKNLEIINDVLLQAISTKRNDGIRFLALNSLVDKEFDFLPSVNGNRILPNNLGFLFISSKSDIIEGNDDLKNRIDIIELTEEDKLNEDYTIDYCRRKINKDQLSEYTN